MLADHRAAGETVQVNHRWSRSIASRVLSGSAVMAVLLAFAVPAHAAAEPRLESASLASAPETKAAIGMPRLAALDGFTPGNIIDDGVFFNSATMSEDDIQRFLEARVPNCQSGYTCLKDWRDTSRTTAADAMCGPYSGAADERASRIIFKVAQACGINPQVILATLQKEQGLVTHTWPSDWRYRIAMGQGCPDTAACDTRYYGFFNQVYGAAWQFKRYANPPGTSRYFTWYAPGNTWNIQFNPNANCGSSPVFVANQATADLYYYTPYQPNAAALAAGTGTGDGCSAYGNRNFYYYFTEWFGTVRGTGMVLVRTAANPAVYLVSNGRRWHVTDGDNLASLSSVFGQVYTVTDGYLSGFTASGDTGPVLRDDSTGEIAYFQDGQRHRLASCDLVSRWGGDCAAPVSVAGSLFQRASPGSEMTAYYRVAGTTQWGRIESSSTVTPMWNEAAARAANGDPGTPIYAASLSRGVLASKTKSPLFFAPAQVVKSTGGDKVYMTIDAGSLVWVRSWNDLAEYNRDASTMAVVSDADLFGRYREVGEVRPLLNCDGSTFFPGSGVIYPLPDPSVSGLSAMNAGSPTCAQFTRGPAMGKAPLIKVAGRTSVAAVDGNTRRVAATWSSLTAYMNGTDMTIATVSAASFDGLRGGAPIADGEIVKGTAATLSLVSGTTAMPLPSFDLARDAGMRTDFVSLADAEIAKLTPAGSPLGVWISCAGTIFAVGSGGLTAVATSAAQGFPVPQLSAAACQRFTVRAGTLQTVFVKSSSSDKVYVATGGVYRHVQSWATLQSLANGNPTVLTLSPSTVAGLPLGQPMS